MSNIHYLRELSLIKKRIALFSVELQHMQDDLLAKRNNNTNTDILIKILNELRSLKMSSIIRYKQQSYQLKSNQYELSNKLLLRTFKERFFLKKIDSEIEKAGGTLEFRPMIYTTTTATENHPYSVTKRILRENATAHSIMADCYAQPINCIHQMKSDPTLIWLLQSMLIMEHKYNHNEQRYQKKIVA